MMNVWAARMLALFPPTRAGFEGFLGQKCSKRGWFSEKQHSFDALSPTWQ